MITKLSILAISVAACVQQDTEIWFGQVAGKEADKSSCTHSYEVCQTCSSTKSDGTVESESCNCTTHYHHTFDYRWSVRYDWDLNGSADDFYWDGDSTNDGVLAMIRGEDRIFKECGDCSLSLEEQRIWTYIERGNRAAVPHYFDNYLLVDPKTLRLNTTEYAPASLPSYPAVYDFHEFDSAINVNTRMDKKLWNMFLAEHNARLGFKLQTHMMVVATYDPNPLYADALASKWVLGKKNNAIFVFGLNSDDTIAWSRLVSFSNVEMMRLRVRDDFVGQHINDQATLNKVASITSEHFKRGQMEDYKYLMRNTWWHRWRWLVLAPIAIVIGVISWLMFVSKRLTRRNFKRRSY